MNNAAEHSVEEWPAPARLLLVAVVIGVALLALGLLSGVSSLGVVLSELTSSGVLSLGTAAALTTLLVVIFAFAGIVSGSLVSRLGVTPTVVSASILTG